MSKELIILTIDEGDLTQPDYGSEVSVPPTQKEQPLAVTADPELVRSQASAEDVALALKKALENKS